MSTVRASLAWVVALHCGLVWAQGTPHRPSDSTGWTFFPESLRFAPLVASPEEPRMGLQQEIATSRMRVAVGNATDLVEYRDGTTRVRVGAEFFVFALANEFKGALLKIDAADGLFGLRATLDGDSPWSLRFRAIHLSAHFVDGHYDPDSREWKDGNEPFPFSRNFGEIVIARALGSARLYAGFTWAAVNKPRDIRRVTLLFGADTPLPLPVPAYAAYHFCLMGTPAYAGTHTAELGLKFGAWHGKGVRLFLSLHSGTEFYGQYYKVRRTIWGAGFTFDFW